MRQDDVPNVPGWARADGDRAPDVRALVTDGVTQALEALRKLKERREHEKVERSVLPRADPVQFRRVCLREICARAVAVTIAMPSVRCARR